MPDKSEGLIKLLYKRWRLSQAHTEEVHPDEEAMACFLENRLPHQESEQIKTHLLKCDRCAESLAAQLKLKEMEIKEVPQELISRVRDLVVGRESPSLLEIFLRLKEKALEIISTTGDVLVGQELVPAPLLRSRKIKDFQDEVNILKDFQDIRVQARIENKQGKAFSLTVVVKEKSTQKIMKDLRVTLIRGDLELESYLNDSGRVTFENVLLGKYTVEISTVESKIAAILIDIKV